VISLRYHIVSLVAVFLALALGIAVGSTVLKEGSVAVLRATSNEIRAQSQQTRADNARLQAEVDSFKRFGEAAVPLLVRGRLKDRSVVLVDTDKVDKATRAKVTDAVKAAGATIDGRVTFASDRVALTAEGDRAALRGVLGVDIADPVALRAALVDRVAGRLAVPARLPQDGRGRDGDTLTSLEDAKFLADMPLERPQASGQVSFPAAGSLFVLIGPTDPTTLAPDAFLIPLADRLSTKAAAVVGVERADGTTSWVTALRAAREVARRVPTVDDVDLPYGQWALVDALQGWLQGQEAGRYGTKEGNNGLLPEKPGS
jgi:hypothetical protein